MKLCEQFFDLSMRPVFNPALFWQPLLVRLENIGEKTLWKGKLVKYGKWEAPNTYEVWPD